MSLRAKSEAACVSPWGRMRQRPVPWRSCVARIVTAWARVIHFTDLAGQIRHPPCPQPKFGRGLRRLRSAIRAAFLKRRRAFAGTENL